LGIEGLALLRHLYDGSEADADRRLGEIRRILDDEALKAAEPMSEADPRVGYAAWSDRYDEPGNPIVAIEQSAVWRAVGRVRPGRALDVACGTGRHARHLADMGHQVVGVDYTPEMLRLAKEQLPGVCFVHADLRAMPVGQGGFDLVVCGLALAHLRELDMAVAELARVLRRGGSMVISVLHPLQAHLGWHAPFEDNTGQRGFVREHSHSHSDYLAVFRRAGLRVGDCVEPRLTPDQVRSKRRAFRHIPDAAMAAYENLPGVLVWVLDKT
jgi:ubiquinone/menaquinone biosynthesis C-methylase UbiE